MEKILIILTLAMILVMPAVLAVDIGSGTSIFVSTQKFAPKVWLCQDRVANDDCTENSANDFGKNCSNISDMNLSERKHNYAFEGESIHWTVLVMDKNKIEDVKDVVGTVGNDLSNNPTVIKVNKTISFCDSTGTRFVPWSQNLTIPKFNTSLGNLVKVSVNGSAFIDVNATFENVDPISGSNFSIIYHGGNISVNFPELNIAFIDSGFIINGNVGPYDNVTDFAGISGKSFDFVNSTLINFQGNNLSVYKANSPGGNIIIPASSRGSAEIGGLANFDGGVRTVSGANVCISYTYEVEEGVSGTGNDVEVECKRIPPLGGSPYDNCRAMIFEENLTIFNEAVMAYYDCRLTVETPASMHGEYFLTVEAMDNTGLSGTMAENEYWFLNPTIALSVDGTLSFEDVMPGTDAYSNTILVGNDAEAGSGVILDMFISGTDFYDPTSSGARCSDNTNKLALREFNYFVTNGAFSSLDQSNADVDPWGYTLIPYSTEISGSKRIMRWNTTPRGAAPSSSVVEQDWNNGNAVSPGSEMAVTFRLAMPEPCVGDFSEGQIYFWGEAI